jgi:hypothetical protein
MVQIKQTSICVVWRSAMRDFRLQRHRTRLHALCMSSIYGSTLRGCEKICRFQHATWCHNALPRHCSNIPTIPFFCSTGAVWRQIDCNTVPLQLHRRSFSAYLPCPAPLNRHRRKYMVGRSQTSKVASARRFIGTAAVRRGLSGWISITMFLSQNESVKRNLPRRARHSWTANGR